MNLLRQAGADVETATKGRVELRFYPGGTQGDDRDVLRKMRIGQLHGGTVRTGVFGGIYSDIQLYNLPMVFRDLDEVDAVRKVMDRVLIEGLAEAGFIAFGIAEVGMAYAMSTKQASAIADARRLKVWSPQGDVPAARTLEAFGISPIPLTIAEVLQSLTSGAIDTVAAPPRRRPATVVAHPIEVRPGSAVHVHLQPTRRLRTCLEGHRTGGLGGTASFPGGGCRRSRSIEPG